MKTSVTDVPSKPEATVPEAAPAAPGPAQIEVRLDDLLSRRKGLVLSNKNRNESTGLVGQVDLPRAQAGRDLSHIEFLWPLQDASAGLAFVRGGRTRVPNPERLYGLYAGVVEAAFTAVTEPMIRSLFVPLN